MAATFAAGLVVGSAAGPLPPFRIEGPLRPALASPAAIPPAQTDLPLAKRLDPGLVYPAVVLRVIDGDTFEARVRV
jgi:hypothetical protein